MIQKYINKRNHTPSKNILNISLKVSGIYPQSDQTVPQYLQIFHTRVTSGKNIISWFSFWRCCWWVLLRHLLIIISFKCHLSSGCSERCQSSKELRLVDVCWWKTKPCPRNFKCVWILSRLVWFPSLRGLERLLVLLD